MAFLGARLVSGIDYLLDLIRFSDVVRDVDLVITGEGSLGEQSLAGKAPWGGGTGSGTDRGAAVVLVGRRHLS